MTSNLSGVRVCYMLFTWVSLFEANGEQPEEEVLAED